MKNSKMKAPLFLHKISHGWAVARCSLAMVCLLLAPLNIAAGTVRDVWLSMPDSLSGVLSAKQRAELLNVADMGIGKEVDNLLGGKSQLLTLSEQFMAVRTSESSTVQLRLLPHGADSVVCVARTFLAPEPESLVEVYNAATWQRLSQVELGLEPLVVRPDTMTEERFEELKRELDPCFVSAQLSADGDVLTLKATVSSLVAEREAASALLVERRLQWDGERFR